MAGWVITEDNRGCIEAFPMNPQERVDSDTWYSFFESEEDARQAFLRKLDVPEEGIPTWAHKDTRRWAGLEA